MNDIIGYYINLNNRQDRKKNIENIKKKYNFFKDIKRMSAIHNKRGDIGCALSHIKCLNEFKSNVNTYKLFMIIEDDFQIINEEKFKNFENSFDNIKNENWDVIILTPRGITYKKNFLIDFHKIIDNQTTTGYIIKENMIDILIEKYKESINNLSLNKNTDIWAIDQNWKSLQNKHNFLYYKEIFAGQLPGYSDVQNKSVNYNDRFIKQYMF
tara:strand:- start:4844 stop:5479 length:636 start_codon:yes stop_codon:yes gene_type:complete